MGRRIVIQSETRVLTDASFAWVRPRAAGTSWIAQSRDNRGAGASFFPCRTLSGSGHVRRSSGLRCPVSSVASSRTTGKGLSPQPTVGVEPLLLVETWLILPVVICLSQRLSHACLSISFYMAKLRMAHYNSYSFFDGQIPTWITVVILELIHADGR